MTILAPARTVNDVQTGREAVTTSPSHFAQAPGLFSGSSSETAVVSTAQGGGCWLQALYRTLGVVDLAVPAERCPGAIRTFRLGHLKLATMEGDAVRLWRARRPSMGSDGLLAFMLVVSGTATVDQDDRRAFLHPGEMVFCDLTRPMSLEFPDRFRVKLLVLPRRLLGVPEEHLRRVVAMPVRPDTTMTSLVAAFLTRLVDTAARCPSLTDVPLASSAVDLLDLLAEEQVSLRSPTSANVDRLLTIKKFIEQNIGDPNLTPQTVAQANSISVRYLHKLFQGDGLSASQWIQRCRLQKCRSELARLNATERSIAGVAHQWGFSSASHFSRAFRSLYGISPVEWRDCSVRASKESVPG